MKVSIAGAVSAVGGDRTAGLPLLGWYALLIGEGAARAAPSLFLMTEPNFFPQRQTLSLASGRGDGAMRAPRRRRRGALDQGRCALGNRRAERSRLYGQSGLWRAPRLDPRRRLSCHAALCRQGAGGSRRSGHSAGLSGLRAGSGASVSLRHAARIRPLRRPAFRPAPSCTRRRASSMASRSIPAR